jgi:hypothetical protein
MQIVVNIDTSQAFQVLEIFQSNLCSQQIAQRIYTFFTA